MCASDCVERVASKGGVVTYRWLAGVILPHVRCAQVYGFCLTGSGALLLVRDSGETRFTLPGGGVEPGEEPESAFRREVREEAQVDICDVTLLGTLEVEVRNHAGAMTLHEQQARYACRVPRLTEFRPRHDGFETEERIEVAPSELQTHIEWLKFRTGNAQYQAFLEWSGANIRIV